MRANTYLIPLKDRLLELSEGMTMEKFADEIGVSRQTVNYWMNGKRQPSAENIKTIAEKFNTNADWILGKDCPKTSETTIKEIGEYTGLSADSIEALHQISHGEGKLKPNTRALFFINAVLEQEKHSAEETADYESSDYGPMTTRPAYCEELYRLLFPLDPGEEEANIDAGEVCFRKSDIRLYKANRTEKELLDLLIDKYNPDYGYHKRTAEIRPFYDLEKLNKEWGG